MHLNNIYSIYLITNLVNNKKYIGFSKQPERRWAEHCCYYKTADKILYRAMKAHSLENFKFEIIYQSKDYEHTYYVIEEQLIDYHNTKVDGWGYNVANGGIGGDVFTNNPRKEEMRKNISIATTGRKHTEESKRKMSIVQSIVQKELSKRPEFKEKMSKLHKGKKLSNDHKEKIRNALSKIKYEILMPNCSIIVCYSLRKFCENNKICRVSLIEYSEKNKLYKGYQIISKTPTK